MRGGSTPAVQRNNMPTCNFAHREDVILACFLELKSGDRIYCSTLENTGKAF